MFCGFADKVKSPLYLPPPLFVSVPISWFVEVTNTCRVAVDFELPASTRRVRFALSYSARVIETVSAAVAVGDGTGVGAGVGDGAGAGVGDGAAVPCG